MLTFTRLNSSRELAIGQRILEQPERDILRSVLVYFVLVTWRYHGSVLITCLYYWVFEGIRHEEREWEGSKNVWPPFIVDAAPPT